MQPAISCNVYRMKLSKDKLLVLSFIALIALGWLISFTQRNTVPSKAAGNPVTITMTAPKTTIAENEELPITITLNTNDSTKKISGFDMYLYTTGHLAITGSTQPAAVGGASVNVNEFVKMITDPEAHLAYAFINPDADLPSAVTFQVKLKVKGTPVAYGALHINMSRTQVVGNISANTFDLPAQAASPQIDIVPGNISVTPGAPQVQVRVQPSSAAQPLNSQFTVSLIIDGQQAGQKISAFDLALQVDPSILRIDSVGEAQDETGSTSKFMKLTNSFNSQTGAIQLNYISIQPEASLPSSAKVDVVLTGRANGTGAVSFTTAQVTGNITQNAFSPILSSGFFNIGTSVSGTPFPTLVPSGTPIPTSPVTGFPTPTVIPSVQPSPTVIPTIPTGKTVFNMKVKLQGITRQPSAQYNSMKMQVMVGKDGYMSAPQIGTFTADAGGVWSGVVAFNDVPAGSGYRIYVKPAKHLQKKFCEAVPVETAAGTYRCADGKISIQDGQNTFDFSKVYAMTGDLPDQNGVVDSYDTSYIKLNLGSSDPKVLQIADLNLDGIVDTQDYSLVIASLSVKYDDL